MAEYRLIFNDDKYITVSDKELIDKILLEQDRLTANVTIKII